MPKVLVVEARKLGPNARTLASTIARLRALQLLAEVHVAHSGWEALHLLRRSAGGFSLVVVDERAGWMDAVELLRGAREMDPALPAIITSAKTREAVVVVPDTETDSPRVLPRHIVKAVAEGLRWNSGSTGPVPPASPLGGGGYLISGTAGTTGPAEPVGV